jgi:Zn-dependent protease with chaperone function
VSAPIPSAPAISAHYFDGCSPQARGVRLCLVDGRLQVIDGAEPATLLLDLDPAALDWPERQRHGPRILPLPDGGLIECHDGPGWDALARAAGQTESVAVRWQQSWRGTLAALLVVCLASGAVWAWGIPLVARGLTALLPTTLDLALGQQTMQQLDQEWLKPSQLSPQRQTALRRQLLQGLARAGHTPGSVQIEFRDAGPLANAFALPGGQVVLTDALLALVDGREDMLLGVVGHEAGHVVHRHGMRQLVQTGLSSAFTALVLGDFSGWLTAAPALLGQLAYSRELEREADQTSLAVLHAQGLDGQPMVEFFERLQTRREPEPPARTDDTAGHEGRDNALAGLLSTHPVHTERIRYFREGR